MDTLDDYLSDKLIVQFSVSIDGKSLLVFSKKSEGCLAIRLDKTTPSLPYHAFEKHTLFELIDFLNSSLKNYDEI